MNSVFFHELASISPLIVLSVGALLIMLLEAFLGEEWPRAEVTALVILGALGALFVNDAAYAEPHVVLGGFLFVDPLAKFLMYLTLIGSLLGLMLGVGKLQREGIQAPGEFYTLYLIALAGAILLACSSELITLFLALETMSMALYCLCGSSLHNERSSESALKYFLLGSFSSAFMLYGIALIYGATGLTSIPEIHLALESANQRLMLVGMALLVLGLVFKIGGFPFHSWVPDVYQGAPNSVTVFMASVIKAAAVCITMRVLYTLFGEYRLLWWSIPLWYIAAGTMVLGNLIAIRQRSVKRMLAYSSIAHAGYMLVGFLASSAEFKGSVAASGDFSGSAAILYYLVAYTAMTLGAFGVLMVVTTPYASEPHSDDITRFNGLGARRPVLAALMALFLLSLAGLPPGMAGLLGKFYIFSAAIKSNYIGLAIIGVLASTVSCYYYLRVIVAMYFVEGEKSEPAAIPVGLPIAAALLLCAVAVVAFGIFPGFIYSAASAAALAL